MDEKVNFLFFITDQHRADWLGCMGHPVLKTPHIDALAATGTIFQNFHVAAPVCMPNRASLMTGRMPSVHGLRNNGCVLPKRANTFVDVLAKGGYRTASIGKCHLQPFTGLAPQRAMDTEKRLIAEAWKTDNADYGHEEPERYDASGVYQMDLPYYGFQHVDMATGHGDQCDGHYGQWFRQCAPDWQRLHDPASQLPHNYSCPQAYRTPVPEALYPTTWIADRAIDYIQESVTHTAPFFAFVSFPDPHHPFNPPGKYWDMYSPEDFAVDLPFEAHQNPTPPMRKVTERWKQGLPAETPQTAFRADNEHVREAMALTAGMITMIDDQIGRVVQALKDSGQFENTVIIFTSDHGDYLGDFNLMLKAALPFRAITRVPMIWSDPSRGDPSRGDPSQGDTSQGDTSQGDTNQRVSSTSQALASTIDISASILDRAGFAPYFGMQGRSFLSCLSDDAAHRDELLIEHNDGGPRMGFVQAARARALVTKDWRLTTYAGESWGELYDLNADPQETNNLWDNPEAAETRAELSLRLIDNLTRQMDESPRAERLA